MKNFLSALIVVLPFLYNCNNIIASPFDTGMNELQQPDETTFIGRIWGDEFFYWMETENGYRFVQSGDGWYYYATLNQDGEFTPTTYKVGIDSPPGYSYQLERSQARIDEINQQIEEFNEQIELNRQWFAQKQAEAQGQPVTLKVAIILIEFKDVKHFEDENYRPDGYLTADFDSMMFSYNYWNGDPGNEKHPEEEAIFGSFRDYWHQMSKGKLKIIGKVVNPTDENGVPEWLEADHTRSYYTDTCARSSDSLAVEAIQKALALGYISDTPGVSNYYDKYAIVYAQGAISSGALIVHANSIGGKFYVLAERSGSGLYGQNKVFTHIGIFAHEFGHTIGFYDEYNDSSETTLHNFCLMALGISNGPDRKAACPATLSPWYRIDRGWISQPELIDSDKVNFLVEYDYNYPKQYRINPVEAPGEMHYLFEVKHREGFDAYIPEPPNTFQNQPGTLLIWQHNIESTYNGMPYYDRIRIKPADSISTSQTQLNDFFPSDGFENFQCLNDTTLPAASLGDFHEEELPELIRPAHFALNGIQKLPNDTNKTLINEIKLTYGLSTFNNSGNWQVVGVPLIVTDYYYKSLFPACSSAFKYNGIMYVLVDTLENGPGYLVEFPAGLQEINMFGDFLKYIEIPVTSGWNIIGSINFDNPVANVCTEPPGIIESIFKFEYSYVLMTKDSTLKPGKGYWVNTTSAGNLILDRDAEPCELPKITAYPEIDLSEMDKFIITDADGFSQTLFVANTDIDTVMAGMNLDLPPFFPELNFDSRFEYNEFVKKVSADSGEIDLSILVHTNAYPVDLSWELNPLNGINYSFINDSGTGKISSTFNETGNKTFNELYENRIRLFAKASKTDGTTNLPTSYALHQNFPNPFNPSTAIKYDLPNTSDVSLIIYDILGRKVKELVNAKQQAGRYEIQFNASSLASGVYIYQLIVEKYISAKKMILLK